MKMVKVGSIELPEYGMYNKCSKCGFADVSTRYCRREEEEYGLCLFSGVGNNEHMHRYCRNCHYTWLESCVVIWPERNI